MPLNTNVSGVLSRDWCILLHLETLFSDAQQLLHPQGTFSIQPQTAVWGTASGFEIVLWDHLNGIN